MTSSLRYFFKTVAAVMLAAFGWEFQAAAAAIVAYGGEDLPDGWLKCDWSLYRTNDCPRLWAHIGWRWGSVNAPSTFHVPDLKGVFLRCWSYGLPKSLSYDPDVEQRFGFGLGTVGDRVGSYQFDATRATPNVWLWEGSETTLGYQPGGNYQGRGSTQGRPPGWPQGAKTRPINASVQYLIKL